MFWKHKKNIAYVFSTQAIRIVACVSDRFRNAEEISRTIHVPIAQVYRHLRELKERGLIETMTEKSKLHRSRRIHLYRSLIKRMTVRMTGNKYEAEIVLKR